MSKGFLGVIVVVILIFVGIFTFGGHKTANSPGKSSATTKPTEHIEGKSSSGLTLVEYGDYQCPFCGDYYPIVKQVQQQYAGRVSFQFRNFPLVSLHQNAFAAARAAEAAGLQGKFWQMHDALYESQDQWSSSTNAASFFNQLAQQLGLDMTKFKADYGSSKVNDLINADTAAGTKLNIQGTPTFFLGGKQIKVTQDPASFAKVIDAALAQKGQGN
jgi:protein-disulfide isomerase